MRQIQELCKGCDATADRHPFIGIEGKGEHRYTCYPVCTACWKDPAHRTRLLKAAFFRLEDEAAALAAL